MYSRKGRSSFIRLLNFVQNIEKLVLLLIDGLVLRNSLKLLFKGLCVTLRSVIDLISLRTRAWTIIESLNQIGRDKNLCVVK